MFSSLKNALPCFIDFLACQWRLMEHSNWHEFSSLFSYDAVMKLVSVKQHIDWKSCFTENLSIFSGNNEAAQKDEILKAS